MGITVYAVPPEPANEAVRSKAIDRTGVLDRVGDPALAELVARACETFGVGIGAITVVRDDCQYVIVSQGSPCGAYRRQTSICGHAILQPDRLFVIEDATLDPRFAENAAVIEEPGLRFYAGAPLVYAPGVALGMLCVSDGRPRSRVEPAHLKALGMLAEEAVAIIKAPVAP